MLILVKYLVILAVIDTFSQTYYDTSVTQGYFPINEYTV